MFDTGDTIAAVSSPPGPAQRGIVRVAGPDALRIAANCFVAADGQPLALQPAWSRIPGSVRLGQTPLPAVACVFRKPRSYTRSDLVELHLLGSPGVLALLLDDLVAAGARRAGPGEFTARAFVAGGLDLVEAQAVAALIFAQSDAELSAARRLLSGDLSIVAAAAREELADLLSLVEGALDFADEPIDFITADQLRDRLAAIESRLMTTLSAGRAAERLGALPQVVLVGLPNVGKSSLLNRLAGRDRAIASPIAGTTRDRIAAPITLPDGHALLVDVAGAHRAADRLNVLAQGSAAAAAQDADLTIHVVDTAAPVAPELTPNTIVVLNKRDLLSSAELGIILDQLRSGGVERPIAVSAATGEGCDQLIDAIAAALRGRRADVREHLLALAVEHRDALSAAIAAIRRAADLAASDERARTDAELIAAELRDAADRMGLLTGELVPDELLGRIFARFCIGK